MSPSRHRVLASQSKEVCSAFGYIVVTRQLDSLLRTCRGPACHLCGRKTWIAVEVDVAAASTYHLSAAEIGKAAPCVHLKVDALDQDRKERHLLAKLVDYNA